MFFIMGISNGRRDFDFTQMVICSACGRYGRYVVYMTYTFLSLFFIPTFRWNRRYFVQMSCCGTTYLLNPEVGRQIARGEDVQIRPEDLQRVGYDQGSWEDSGWNRANWTVDSGDNSSGAYGNAYGAGPTKRCTNCGFTTNEDFDFCPKCGRQF